MNYNTQEDNEIIAQYTCIFSFEKNKFLVLLGKRNQKSFWHPKVSFTANEKNASDAFYSQHLLEINPAGEDLSYGKSCLGLIGNICGEHTDFRSDFFAQTGINPPLNQSRYREVLIGEMWKVGVVFSRLNEKALLDFTNLIQKNLLEANNIISAVRKKRSNFSQAFSSSRPPVYSNTLNSVTIYEVNEGINILSPQGHSKYILQFLKLSAIKEFTFLEDSFARMYLQMLFNFSRSSRFTKPAARKITERVGITQSNQGKVKPAVFMAAVPNSVTNALLPLNTETNTSVTSQITADSMQDILHQTKEAAVTVLLTPKRLTDGTPDGLYANAMQDLLNFDSLVSAIRGIELQARHKDSWDFTRPSDEVNFMRVFAESTEFALQKCVQYFQLENNKGNFNDSWKFSANMDGILEALTDTMINKCGFHNDSAQLVMKMIRRLRDLSVLGFTLQEHSTAEFYAINYLFEGNEGTIKTPKLRKLSFTIDGDTWNTAFQPPPEAIDPDAWNAAFEKSKDDPPKLIQIAPLISNWAAMVKISIVETTGLVHVEELQKDWPQLQDYIKELDHRLDGSFLQEIAVTPTKIV